MGIINCLFIYTFVIDVAGNSYGMSRWDTMLN